MFVIPLVVYQIYCDVLRQSRELLAELTGAIAISSSSAVIVLVGGWSYLSAVALWGVFIARLIPSILYVRNRLRLEKGKDSAFFSVVLAHSIALALVTILNAYDLVPKLVAAMFVVLLIRAAWGLSRFRRRVKAMKIGMWEVVYGTSTVLAVIAGYYLQA